MDERSSRQDLAKQLREKLLALGLDCGIPFVQTGDEFVLPKNESGRMQLVRCFVEAMTARDCEPQSKHNSASDLRVRNSFVVHSRMATKSDMLVEITDALPRADGSLRVQHRTSAIVSDASERLNFQLRTFLVGSRIMYESELEAHKKLESLVDADEYELYVVTGMLRVTGKSGTLYVIRKSRPTLAFAEGSNLRPLCALCMHPLGYFASTWMGALPPTDEVVAHLLMIRSDEHYFWRKANQIPLTEPNSGV